MQNTRVYRLGCLAVCVVFLVLAGNCNAANIRVRRQANFNFNTLSCPQQFGQFEMPGQCSRFIQCDNGVPSVQDCQPNLVFNAARGYCDFPANVPACISPQRGVTSSPAQEVNYDICASAPNGGDAINGYQVPHPTICNAFYTCSSSYMYAPCTFCPEHMYFSLPERRCRSNTTGDFPTVCQGREYVSHAEKVHRQLDGMCRPTNGVPAPIFDQNNSGHVPPGGVQLVGVPYAPPVVAHPILAHPIVAHPFVPNPIVPQPIMAHPVVAHPVVAHPVVAHPIVAHPIYAGRK